MKVDHKLVENVITRQKLQKKLNKEKKSYGTSRMIHVLYNFR